MLCENVQTFYHTTRFSSDWYQDLLPAHRALERLSAILQQHVENNELPVLQELDVGTIPERLYSPDYHKESQSIKVMVHLTEAIKSMRVQNSEGKGLKKLKIGAPQHCVNTCLPFMSSWVDPHVDVEVSFAYATIIFPRDSPEGTAAAKVKVKQLMRWQHVNFSIPSLADVDFEVETLDIRNDPSILHIPNLFSFERTSNGEKVRTLRIVYDVADLPAFWSLRGFLDLITSQFLPKLTTLELPAEVVSFSGYRYASLGLLSYSNDSIKNLHIYGFRDSKVTRFDEAIGRLSFVVDEVSIEELQQKASWFLNCLPQFLQLLREGFPNLELIYMEQKVIESFCVVEKDFWCTMCAIDRHEKASGVDASTLRTEIMEWRSPTDFTSCEDFSLQCSGVS